MLQAYQVADVLPVMAEVGAAVQGGCFAAGFVSYEAASGFDPALTTHPRGRLPLVSFGLFEGWSAFTWPRRDSTSRAAVWSIATDRESYGQRLAYVHQALADGRAYQVNHTERLVANGVDPFALFLDIAEHTRFGTFIETPDYSVVSASPELLFELTGDTIICKPMKGTAQRSSQVPKDQAQAMWLQTSAKNCAENVMITDMVRHDLGRIARTGSVKVTELFGIERLTHVWQMTSTVEARTAASVIDIFRAIFPGASVTGAPKAASMRIIHELETSPREIYTGAIGVIEPGQKARFSIAIRTAWFDRRTGQAVYGAGGGIVWDSDPAEEWQELAAKAQVVNQPSLPSFALIETLRFSLTDGYFLRHLHRDRMATSADWFNRPFDPDGFDRLLDHAARGFKCDMRVRVMLDSSGRFRVQASTLVFSSQPVEEIVLATLPLELDSALLHHKTSLRTHYDPLGNGEEVLLCNLAGRVTESSIANVIFQINSKRFTPPSEDGLLAGVYRRHLLDQGLVAERSLAVADLAQVERLWLVNALRGEREVITVKDTEGRVRYRVRQSLN